MSLIKVYKDNPTTGLADGTLVSSLGDREHQDWDPIYSGPIEVPEEGYQEGNWVKLAVRCDPAYETVEKDARHVRLSIEGTTHSDKWQLAPDNAGAAGTPEDWGASLDVLSQVGDTNHIFWARARAEASEEPINDISCTIKALARIGAV